MKSDHRHELKTNELADWLAHFPEWLKANRNTLIAAGAVIVVAVVVYIWMFYQTNVAAARNQIRLTNLVTQLPQKKAELLRPSEQGDQSYVLLDLARELQDFAGTSGNKAMAALALIERAETLRAELHYRRGEVTQEEIAKQIGLAQASYEQAIQKAPTAQPALIATARFGLGLCEEELGNYDKAREIYRDVAENTQYAGTAAQAAAALRSKTMDDYKGTVVFKPAPEPPMQMPMMQLTPGDMNGPVIGPMPDTNAAPTTSEPPGAETPATPADTSAPTEVAPTTSEPPAVEVVPGASAPR